MTAARNNGESFESVVQKARTETDPAKIVTLCGHALAIGSKTAPDEVAYLYLRRADAHQHLKMYEQCIEDCSVFLALDTTFSTTREHIQHAHMNRGYAYAKLNKYKAAHDDYDLADPKHRYTIQFKQFIQENAELKKEHEEHTQYKSKLANHSSSDKTPEHKTTSDSTCDLATGFLLKSRDTKDNPKEAIKHCNSAIFFYDLAILKDPKNAKAYHQRGIAYLLKAFLSKGIYPQVIADFTCATVLASRTHQRGIIIGSYYELGQFYKFLATTKKENSAAIHCVESAVKSYRKCINEALKDQNLQDNPLKWEQFVYSYFFLAELHEQLSQLKSDKEERKYHHLKMVEDYIVFLWRYDDPENQKSQQATEKLRTISKEEIYSAVKLIEPPKVQIAILRRFLDKDDLLFGQSIAFMKEGIMGTTIGTAPNLHKKRLGKLAQHYLDICQANPTSCYFTEAEKVKHEALVQEIQKNKKEKPHKSRSTMFPPKPEVKEEAPQSPKTASHGSDDYFLPPGENGVPLMPLKPLDNRKR